MATKILVRRGVVADLDQETLDEGEIAFTTDELGLYVGSNAVTEGYVKVNKTGNIEYDGNALTSATDTNNLKEAVENIDVALKTEQNNVDTLQSDLDALESNVTSLSNDYNEHAHGNINRSGEMTNTAATPGTGDLLVFTDSSDEDKVTRGIAIDLEGTGFLKEDGTWSMPNVDDLTNVTITDKQSGQVLKWDGTAWVNSSDIDVNTKYTADVADTTVDIGSASRPTQRLVLDASTGESDDIKLNFIQGSNRVFLNRNSTNGIPGIIINSFYRPVTVNTNDPLELDEEMTLSDGHNIVITETAGAITIATPEDLTLNNVDDVLGSDSHSIIFKNKWFQGGEWVNGENKLWVDEQRKLIFQPASDSSKVVLTTDTLIDELFDKSNTWLDEQRFQADLTLGAKNQAGVDPSYRIKFEYGSAATPNYLDLYAEYNSDLQAPQLILEDDGTKIVLGTASIPQPSIVTQSSTEEVTPGDVRDSILTTFSIDNTSANLEIIEGANMRLVNVSTGKFVISALLRPVEVNGTRMLDANNLDTEALNLVQGTNITISEADGDVTFDVPGITTDTQTALNLKAPIDSPAFTTTATAPTPSTGDNSTKIATTQFVKTAVDNAVFGDTPVEWIYEGAQFGELLPSGYNVFIDDIQWDFDNYDYKVVFFFETTGEDNDEPYMRFNGLTNMSTSYNSLTKRTSSETDTVIVESLENTSLIRFGAKLPTNSNIVGQTQYNGEFIICRSFLGSPVTSGNVLHNYSVRGFASVTAATAPVSGFIGYPVESIFIGNFTSSAAFSSVDIYPSISAGSSDYAKARIYKRAK
jgi:hypothetical protein